MTEQEKMQKEMDKLLASMEKEINGGKKMETKPKPKKTSKSSKGKRTTIDPVGSQSPLDPTVSEAIHCYTRPGETPGTAGFSALDFRKRFGPSVAIFAHDHEFGGTCSDRCRERILKDA